MAEAGPRERYLRMLVQQVRSDAYPSSAHMDRIEAVLPRELLPAYIELLLDKVEGDRYPSSSLLLRIERLMAQAG